MKNAFLKSEADTIIGAGALSSLHIDLIIRSTTDLSFTFTPIFIDYVRITQAFLAEIGDSVFVTFPCGYSEYIKLFENKSDLTATFIVTFLNNEGLPVSPNKEIRKSYRAILINPKDISKQVVDAHLRSELDDSVTIRLIEEELYQLRHAKINAIYTGVTVEEAIESITTSMGISSFQFVKPDNSYRYSHLIIPPFKSFYDVYLWIHTNYGVYMEGLVHYFYNGTLYIYPPFDTNPTFDYTLIVVQLDKGEYAGVASNHMFNGTNLHVVTNTVNNVMDNSMMNGENNGTDVSFYRSAELLDGGIDIDSDRKTPLFKNNNGLTLGLKDTKLSQSKARNTNYVGSTDNPFTIASALVAKNNIKLDFQWTQAIPYALFPGMAVKYMSDENGALVQRTGILHSVESIFRPINTLAKGRVFVGTANVDICLSPYTQTTSSNSGTYDTTTGNKTQNVISVKSLL